MYEFDTYRYEGILISPLLCLLISTTAEIALLEANILRLEEQLGRRDNADKHLAQIVAALLG